MHASNTFSVFSSCFLHNCFTELFFSTAVNGFVASKIFIKIILCFIYLNKWFHTSVYQIQSILFSFISFGLLLFFHNGCNHNRQILCTFSYNFCSDFLIFERHSHDLFSRITSNYILNSIFFINLIYASFFHYRQLI